MATERTDQADRYLPALRFHALTALLIQWCG
jgi:hypothetical protein